MKTLTGYYPTREILEEFIRALAAQVQVVGADNASLSDQHNAYTDHVLALLMCCTGHRPVADPFAEFEQFDLARGMLLISDKVIDESRAWRLVALPDVAVRQMHSYMIYLRDLALWFSRSKFTKPLATKIASLNSTNSKLPLFFYLDEQQEGNLNFCTPAMMATRWWGFWPFPVNYLRHVMTTELLRQSGRADLVQLQLGHTDGVDHPLGITSNQLKCEIFAEVRGHLEASMQTLGWKALAPPKLSSILRQQATSTANSEVPHKLFGHKLRAHKRYERHCKVNSLVREVMAVHLNPSEPINGEQFNAMQVSLISHANQRSCSAQNCMRLLYRFVRARRGGVALLKKFSIVRIVEAEPSPFTEHSLVNYRRVLDVRLAFVTHLHECGVRMLRATPLRRVAEIICSAALFGGCAVEERLQNLGAALLSGTFKIAGQLSVEVPLIATIGRPGVYRWHPDPLSAALIEGLYSLEQLPSSISVAKLEKAVADLFSELGITIKRRAALGELSVLSGSALLFEVPGYIAGVLHGEIPAVSVPLQPWVRVTRGLALSHDISELTDDAQNHRINNWAPVARGCTAGASGRDEARNFVNLLRGLISQAADMPVLGNQRAKTANKLNLVDLLRQEFSVPSKWSYLPLLLVDWALHLCQAGTQTKSDIAFSTVRKYVMLLANHLIPLAAEWDFMALDEAEIETLYLRTVENQQMQQRYDTASRLRQFHAFLVDRYGLDELDWSAVMSAGGAKNIVFADANYLTHDEYHKVLNCIMDDEQLPQLLKLQYSGLMIFGFRFGLRFGESLRLQFRDVQYEDNEMCVWVHHTSHGDTKSEASVRIVPLLEVLSEHESKILKQLLSYAEAGFDTEHRVPLMSLDFGQRNLLNRSAATVYLHYLLRQLTGDHTLRFHHLRHGWATRISAWQQGLDLPGFNRSSNLDDRVWREFIASGDGSFPLRSLATATGHTSECTTIASYVHCTDVVAQSWLRKSTPRIKGDYALSYALQIKYATVRSRRKRGFEVGKLASIPEPKIATCSSDSFSTGVRQDLHPSDIQLSLDVLDKFFIQCRNSRNDLDVLAEKMLISKKLADRLLLCAREIERDTGYFGYKLTRSSADPIFRTFEVLPQIRSFALEDRRIEVELHRLTQKFANNSIRSDILLPGLLVWQRTVLINKGVCVVTNTDDLQLLLNSLDILSFYVNISLSIESGNTRLKQYILLKGLPIDTNLVPKPRDGARNSRTGRAAVNIRPKTNIGPSRSLNRIIFLLIVFLSVKPYRDG